MANKRKQLLKLEEDQKLLLAFTKCKDGEMRTKIQAVRLYGNNVSVAEIPNLTGLPRRTINRWYSRYLRLGLNGFVDNRRGGNNTYLTDEQIQDLTKKLNQYRPVDLLGLEKVATVDGLHWSVPDPRQAVKQWYMALNTKQLPPTISYSRNAILAINERLKSIAPGQR